MTAGRSLLPTPARLSLTVVIPVRNEAANLPGCLAAIHVARRIVVVDSGSSDGTPDIARAAGAEVLDFDWPGGFPKKRNWVLLNHEFDTDWILFLDADEHLTPEFEAELSRTLDSAGSEAGFWLNYTNYFLGRPLRHGLPQRKLALLRAGAGLYEKIDDARWSDLDMEVHEHPVLSGPAGEIHAPIDHRDFRSLHRFIARHNEYSSWEAHRAYDLIRNPDKVSALTPRQKAKYRHLEKWWYPYAFFIMSYVLKRGFLDGRRGLTYALMKFGYYCDIQTKLLEIRHSEEAAAEREEETA